MQIKHFHTALKSQMFTGVDVFDLFILVNLCADLPQRTSLFTKMFSAVLFSVAGETFGSM